MKTLTGNYSITLYSFNFSNYNYILIFLYRARKTEIDALSGTSEFSEFYGRLKAIKDYHRRYPNETVEPLELEFINQSKQNGEDDGICISISVIYEWNLFLIDI